LRPIDRRARLSAVIACYRDAPAVPHMYQRLKKVFAEMDVEGEIIFVNDASPDDAAQVLADLAANDPWVVVVNHSRNFGSQAAFTSGMRLATGDAVVLLDGDLQDPPELIPRLYERWCEGYHVVYGERVQREATRFLRFAYKAFYRVFRALSYVNVPRDAGDFSLIDRRVVEVMNRMPERDRFLRGLRAWVGFKQIGVPYIRPERMFGRTTNSLLKNIAWARKGILSFSYAPLEAISYLAFGVTALSALAILFHLVSFFALRRAPSGFMTLLTAVLFLGGVQLLCLGIIGDYLGRVFEEVKRRPRFIVESVLNHPDHRPPAAERAGQTVAPAGNRP
jgi:polyisoprenyl-phosphate glycosyltransferase